MDTTTKKEGYKFPETEAELDLVFINGECPTLKELNGKYAVEMLSGVLKTIPILKLCPDFKVFDPEILTGYNIFKSGKKWGHFFLEKGSDVQQQTNFVDVVVINYNRLENGQTKKVRDHIRRVGDGVYLGKLNLFMSGQLYFWGYFSLTKTQDE